MPLNLEQPGAHQFIRSHGPGGVVVGETYLSSSFVLSPEKLIPDWPVTQIQHLTAGCLQALLDQEPELVLLGTGKQQVFPPTEVLMTFLAQGIGVEVMSSAAACRTFNICVHEGRRVVAGIMLD